MTTPILKQFKHENERMSHSRITDENYKLINKLNFSAVLLIIKYELRIQGYIIITLNKNVDALSNLQCHKIIKSLKPMDSIIMNLKKKS